MKEELELSDVVWLEQSIDESEKITSGARSTYGAFFKASKTLSRPFSSTGSNRKFQNYYRFLI